jgi:hypothetical protein
MGLPLVLEEIVLTIKKQYSLPAVIWTDENPTEEDMKILEREAMSQSPFDKVNFRKEMWEAFKVGRVELLCKVCPYGKVLVLKELDTDLKMSWSVWGRILQGFDTPAIARICWYAHPQARILPAPGIDVGAEHVNGGYTLPCRTDAIVIYRLEEATRVLIHELLHATCTDKPGQPVEFTEAKTETYAELFLIGYASRGSVKLAEKLWADQRNWIHSLNTTLAVDHGVQTMADYSARYTLARTIQLADLGLSLPTGSTRRVTSSRFTTAKLDKYLA